MLCEMDDLASGTSSAATKLVHGGLRYLEHYKFRLVQEALAEREVLWASAPHIIWPLRFVLPHHKGLRPAWLLRLGLFVYDYLGGRKLLPGTRTLDLRQGRGGRAAQARVPGPSSTPTAGSTMRGWWRSMPAMPPTAAPTIRTRTKVLSARRESGAVDDRGRGSANARADDGTGAAARQRRRPVGGRVMIEALGQNGVHNVRLVKGSHIVTRRCSSTTAATSSRTRTAASSSPFPMRTTSR
jgi:glycerol-3-phosphate dehydrogenase